MEKSAPDIHVDFNCYLFTLRFSMCTVHGFTNATYDVSEGEMLGTTFGLNVKGNSSLPELLIYGTITSEMGSAST